ncbi:hypothetical protein GCM10009104_18270 [Marinobacterium maritimum]|uniref:Uncharacterized protein n=1 Tax=Marinobacterium maritimum TaxID=500162 RepID=A0ABN1I679_9GAMM
MVDMDVGGDQCPDAADVKADCVTVAAVTVSGFVALKQAAVDQQAGIVVDVKLVT